MSNQTLSSRHQTWAKGLRNIAASRDKENVGMDASVMDGSKQMRITVDSLREEIADAANRIQGKDDRIAELQKRVQHLDSVLKQGPEKPLAKAPTFPDVTKHTTKVDYTTKEAKTHFPPVNKVKSVPQKAQKSSKHFIPQTDDQLFRDAVAAKLKEQKDTIIRQQLSLEKAEKGFHALKASKSKVTVKARAMREQLHRREGLIAHLGMQLLKCGVDDAEFRAFQPHYAPKTTAKSINTIATSTPTPPPAAASAAMATATGDSDTSDAEKADALKKEASALKEMKEMKKMKEMKEKELKAMKEKTVQLTEQLETQNCELHQARDNYKKSKSMVALLREELDCLSVRFDNQNAQLASKDKELEAMVFELQEQRMEMEAVQDEMNTLQARVDHDYQVTTSVVSEEVEMLRTALAVSNEETIRLQAEVTQFTESEGRLMEEATILANIKTEEEAKDAACLEASALRREEEELMQKAKTSSPTISLKKFRRYQEQMEGEQELLLHTMEQLKAEVETRRITQESEHGGFCLQLKSSKEQIEQLNQLLTKELQTSAAEGNSVPTQSSTLLTNNTQSSGYMLMVILVITLVLAFMLESSWGNRTVQFFY